MADSTTGGGETGGELRLPLEEDDCKGEGKLTVATVGVAGERELSWLSLRRSEASVQGGCCGCYCWGHGGGEKEKFFAGERGRERQLLLALVRWLGDGWDVVFQGKDGGEISGGN